jgi:hypothetical protein
MDLYELAFSNRKLINWFTPVILLPPLRFHTAIKKPFHYLLLTATFRLCEIR